MPYINVTIAGQPDPALSAKIAAKVSELTKHHLCKDPNITAVNVSYNDPKNWFVGGKSLASQNASSFWLDIKVVDGTNTKQEIAGYLKDVYAELSSLIGNVHHESYILADEVPASDYGFGGKTQEFRFIEGQLNQL